MGHFFDFKFITPKHLTLPKQANMIAIDEKYALKQ